jgi:hypothetical protein
MLTGKYNLFRKYYNSLGMLVRVCMSALMVRKFYVYISHLQEFTSYARSL